LLILPLQKEIRGGNAVQLYKCPVPDCGKEYSSMDVFELLSRDPGGGGRLTCGICGTEIEMVLDEGGKQLGSMEDKKERIRVRRSGLAGSKKWRCLQARPPAATTMLWGQLVLASMTSRHGERCSFQQLEEFVH
jgi:hypothetical protein